jgi:hypothetical protein
MQQLSPSLVQSVSNVPPLNLALLIVGVIALAVVWLAAVAIKAASKK